MLTPIVFFYKVCEKLLREYREYVFLRMIDCKHKDLYLVGGVHLINKNIKLGRNVCIYPGCMFFGDGLIEIGNDVDIGNNTIIYASKDGGGVKIGNGTMIAANCYIIDCDHGVSGNKPIREQKNTVKKVLIGENCWLGANVTILKGSEIGDGTVIGAKSLVKGIIEKNVIAVGIPARVIKHRV